MSKVGRNDPCPCGSGKKYKKCHGDKAMVMKADENTEKVKAINQNGLNAILYRLIDAVGGKFTISIDELSKVSKDCKFLSKINEAAQTIEIWTDDYEKKPLIEVPKLIIGGR